MTILKSKLSSFYFKDLGEWVPNPEGAMTFHDEWQARDFARRERIDDVMAASFEEEVTAEELAALA